MRRTLSAWWRLGVREAARLGGPPADVCLSGRDGSDQLRADFRLTLISARTWALNVEAEPRAAACRCKLVRATD